MNLARQVIVPLVFVRGTADAELSDSTPFVIHDVKIVRPVLFALHTARSFRAMFSARSLVIIVATIRSAS